MFRVFLLIILIPAFVCISSGKAQTPISDSTDTTQNESTSRFNRLIDDIIGKIEREVMWHIGTEIYKEEESDTAKLRIAFDTRKGAIHFTGDVVIDRRDRIDGNIVVRNGTLTVRGQIDGDVHVFGGDVVVTDGGTIDGNVTVVNGSVHTIDGQITGTIEEKQDDDIDVVFKERKPAQRAPYRLSNSLQDDIAARDIYLNPFWMGYNRVEGFSLNAGSRKNLYWDGSMAVSLYGQLGYAFKAHRWRGQLGAARQFVAGDNNLLEFGGEVYTLTDTKDEWIIGRAENDAAAFFFQWDYRDYYDREGFSLYTGHYLNTQRFSTHVRIQYMNELHSSMQNKTDWSLFVRSRSFRVNPPIDEGRLNAIRVALHTSSVNPSPQQIDGWSLLAAMEYSSSSLNSDFDYTQYILDVRRYIPFSRYDNFNFRIRAGSSERELPIQRTYELGGLGTLTAFPHKAFMGNRMILVNAEYIVRGGVLSQLTFIPRNSMTLLFFLDSGWTGIADQTAGVFQGFDDFSFNAMNTSIGFGFGSRDGNTRLGIAWRTDRASSPVIFLRIDRPF